MHERIVEDRVFGLERTIPPAALASRASTSFDLLSTRVEGAEVVYAQEGTVNHPPLVFLHGWGASHKFWKYAFAAFSPRWRCIAPDLVGWGLSEKPRRDYSMEAYASWLGRFLDALGLPRVALVGHSMGGTIALLFALAHPERIERLAVSNPVIDGRTAFRARLRALMAPGIRGAMFRLSRVRWIRRWATKDFSYVQALEEDLAEDVVRATRQSSIDSMADLLRIDLGPRLSSLAVPTLAIGTDLDLIVRPDQVEKVPAQKRARIYECGHIPMVERPGEFNEALHQWLASSI